MTAASLLTSCGKQEALATMFSRLELSAVLTLKCTTFFVNSGQ